MQKNDGLNIDEVVKKVVESKTYCIHCLQEINSRAFKCHHCNAYQKKCLNYIVFIPIIVVFLTFVQLGLAIKERVDSSRILQDIIQKKEEVDKLTRNVKNQIDNITKGLDTTQKTTSEKLKEFSDNISRISIDTGNIIEKTIKSIDNQVALSNERLSKIDTEFVVKNRGITDELHILKKETTKELEKLKWRDRLMILADESISNGDRSAFNKLKDLYLKENNKEKKDILLSYLFQVKNFYSVIKKHGGNKIYKSGEEIDINSLQTKELIAALRTSPEISVRLKATEALGKRKETGVPDALIDAINNDETLDIVAESVRSFSSVTGYVSPDVFGDKYVNEYWEKNKEKTYKTLKPQIDLDSFKKKIKYDSLNLFDHHNLPQNPAQNKYNNVNLK